MDLTQAQASQIRSIHARVLKTILQLPKHTSYDTMLYITGEAQLTLLLKAKRINNLQRIRHLSKHTQLRKLYEQKKWHTRGFIFRRYEKDLREVKHLLRLTDATETDFTQETSKTSTQATKKNVKHVCAEIIKASLFHRLQLKHDELLEGLHSSQATPHLEKSSLKEGVQIYGQIWLFKLKKPRFCNASKKDPNITTTGPTSSARG